MWSDEELEEQPQERRKLRGWIAYDLVQELAFGDQSHTALGERYGVTRQAIQAFAKRNAERIAEVVANKDDAYAGLWIAKKERRIAEYLRDVEEVNDLDTPDAQLKRVKHNALRAVAEELGQLKTNVEVESKVHYTVEGVDLDKLR